MAWCSWVSPSRYGSASSSSPATWTASRFSFPSSWCWRPLGSPASAPARGHRCRHSPRDRLSGPGLDRRRARRLGAAAPLRLRQRGRLVPHRPRAARRAPAAARGRSAPEQARGARGHRPELGRRHHRQDARRHHHQLERGGGASLRLHRGRGDRPLDRDHRAAGPPRRASSILARLARGGVEHYETVRVRKDGSRVQASVTISPILGTRAR